MVPKTNINWKGFKNRAIGNQFSPTPNKPNQTLSFSPCCRKPIKLILRFAVDQACECMRKHQAETNPGRDERKKKKENPTRSEKQKKKKIEHLSSCHGWLFWARGEVPAHHYAVKPVSRARKTGGFDPSGRAGTDGVASDSSKHSKSILLLFNRTSAVCIEDYLIVSVTQQSQT